MSDSEEYFHGFSDNESFPDKLIINSVVIDGVEVLDSVETQKTQVRHRGKRGRPRVSNVEVNIEELEPRKRPALSGNSPRTQAKEPPCIPRVSQGSGSRPKVYLIEKTLTELSSSKLPKTEAVLSRFLENLDANSDQKAISDALKKTKDEVKAVWKYHFGSRLIDGKEFGCEEKGEEKKKIIQEDKLIEKKIKETWEGWKKLEYESRRSARASSKRYFNELLSVSWL